MKEEVYREEGGGADEGMLETGWTGELVKRLAVYGVGGVGEQGTKAGRRAVGGVASPEGPRAFVMSQQQTAPVSWVVTRSHWVPQQA